MPIQNTTEFAATAQDVIGGIVRELQSSPRKYKVFAAIYSGGNKPKDAKVLASKTHLPEVVVLQLATPMAHKQYLEQVREKGRVAFRKYPHINAVRHLIFRLAKKRRLTTTASRRTIPTQKPSRALLPTRQNGTKRRTRIGFDVFVSHATEDKDFVAPLVKALERARIRVWYDNNMMGWGDELRSSIDRGLASCRYGIVVFSKAFLKGKHWTEHELNGLFAKERAGHKVILPIWHKIKRGDLVRYSPAFADRIAKISQRDSIGDIVTSLKALLGKR